jgi:hypothetical protein
VGGVNVRRNLVASDLIVAAVPFGGTLRRSCRRDWCKSDEAVVIIGRAGSIKDGGQLDHGIIAQRRDRFQAHVTAALNCPLIVLFKQ